MTRTLKNCPAPAKLNLFLHVNGRRADGYHLLQTVFQLLDYCDLLDFETRDDGIIQRITDIPGIPAETDLIVRAAKLLQTAMQKKLGQPPPGANITVNKILPMGGGLGGGSSDAATTLMALNHLWDGGFSRAELMVIGLQLGADVPFFIFGQNAFAEGVGETLMPVDTRDYWYIVIEPGVQISTSLIFSSEELTRTTKLVKIADFSGHQDCFGKNDLQIVATKLFPAVAEVINWLNAYGNARMTGSGACVFCAFEQESQADEVLKLVPQRWKVWKAKGISFHPLKDLL
ncbi:4-(cytidine 5'-diphospho)-2-C-methyl-D-erythritol kinase [Glaciimonas sp. Gout2]|uniref:4-(cytidine 5'-diphospho)-2-C-methyl-D-erythritol kinase n=2 Tax=Glaciimonas TaxID=1229970 RepID=UPI002AB3C318|nr:MULTISPECIES: 4-(cytidine 5'-diphospho)-2-C-methyl-D-erythritol kinase [unclassified Glaciimonas]MDY7545547.1 4-(cytidine 5'-diphospho)-2-C-methyl-D-erythritol kinase [Glaciimonas sp. CA11.2]MEB0012766.1 4-(cytidine 5'-diphospho)-2-C-methyl-D-erythritol kinase [Glaciimonas sp. Cout2]MEB0082244.1 4-(cytidine 5'-diphospho)-2-C-methyl-D-erythritol kinase [Glaciimonas sp. Gout2]